MKWTPVGTEEVTKSIGAVNQAPQEAGTASAQVPSAATELSENSTRLKTEGDKFMAQIRTG